MEWNELIEEYKPDFAFAYGSAVVKQKGTRSRMVDLVFGVEDPKFWHKQNLAEHPKDYSFLSRNFKLTGCLTNIGPHVYYNTGVKFRDEEIKYGVMGIQAMATDLTEWRSLFVSGRLQKPVKILVPNEKLKPPIKDNLEHALHTALLMLPEHFSEIELYTTICGLSYRGDIRNVLFENPKKIFNIVEGGFEEWQRLYETPISDSTIERSGDRFVQDKHPSIVEQQFSGLPKNLLDKLRPVEATGDMPRQLDKAIRRIIGPATLKLAYKGLYACNLNKTLGYVFAKFKRRVSQ